jgi:hypothetical protein
MTWSELEDCEWADRGDKFSDEGSGVDADSDIDDEA